MSDLFFDEQGDLASIRQVRQLVVEDSIGDAS